MLVLFYCSHVVCEVMLVLFYRSHVVCEDMDVFLDSVANEKDPNSKRSKRSKGYSDITQGSSLTLLQELGPKPVVVQRQANEWKMSCFFFVFFENVLIGFSWIASNKTCSTRHLLTNIFYLDYF